MKKKIVFIGLLGSILFILSCRSTLPYIDTARHRSTYPYKKLIAQKVAKVEYYVLDAKMENDPDLGGRILRIDKNLIIAANCFYGDVAFFDRSGKQQSFFNCKGKSDSTIHSYISNSFWDASRKELWLCDNPYLHRIVVYNKEGDYLRTIITPDTVQVGQLLDYDSDFFLAYDEKRASQMWNDKKELADRKPFVLISKKDGHVKERLPIHSIRYFPHYVHQDSFSIAHNSYMSFVNGRYVFADIGSDTIYSYLHGRKDGIFHKIPPAWIQKDYLKKMWVNAWTDRYLFLSGMMLYDINRKKFFLYHIENEDICHEENKFTLNSDYPGLVMYADNVLCRTYSSDSLIAWDKRGLLSGKLKKMIPQLKPGDNDVYMLMSF